jgi:hypothetical protein
MRVQSCARNANGRVRHRAGTAARRTAREQTAALPFAELGRAIEMRGLGD